MTSEFDVPSNWYEAFFTAPANRFWESMMTADATRAEVDFFLRHTGMGPPGRIVDIACGAGRHSLALASLGYRVTGIDISADAIGRARRTAAESGVAVEFILGDLRSESLPPALDAMIWLGGSLAYFAPQELPRLLFRLAADLRPEGQLLIETYCCAESLFPLEQERETEFDGGTYRSSLRYDPMHSLLKTKAELRLAGERHELVYAHYVLTSGELVRLLGGAGLRTVGQYGGTSDQPYAPGCRRLLLLAQRD